MTKKILLIAFIAFSSLAMVGQTTITGTVKDAKTGEVLPGANIKVSRKAVGTTTDFDGNFELKVSDNPPFTLEISVLGFKTEKVEITKKKQRIDVVLEENETSLDEIVVSASRTPERIMESPVTVERMDIRAIKNTSAPSFYDGLENLKGVDINTNSLTFKSVNTRGFATFANTRFMQLVDGMDNSSPALNFAIGNLLGMSELDVKTVELLPGASSALYGANAFNGIMFMTSKSPFEDQGISVSVKGGVTTQEAAGTNEFTDINVRMARAFSEKFAAKVSFSYLDGEEWHATDDRNTENQKFAPGTRNAENPQLGDAPNFDGVNIYGDFASANIKNVAQILERRGLIPAGASALVPDENVSRTGYNETDLINNEARSVKFNSAFHFRPFGDDRLEVIWNSKFGTGNTIFQGGQRYSIKNFFLAQHKLEVRGKNFFVRGYTTNEDAGDSYNLLFAGININRAWKDDQTWFGEYVGGYLGATLQGANGQQAHLRGRLDADRGRLIPGTEGFQDAFERIIADPDLQTGAKFRDQTKLYHSDINYNLRDVIDFAEFQVGGSYRKYVLNSFGNIFTDADGPIDYDEFGIYTQMQKNFLEEDRLKLTASVRYDKAQNFDGNFSPRISLAYAAGEDKNDNFRASFQTGFRNPTTQDQYIGLDVGSAILVGSAPDNLERFSNNYRDSNGNTFRLTGRDAYQRSFSIASLLAGSPELANVDLVQPERVSAFEIGYRGLVNAGENRVTLDVSAYYNFYQDFISARNVRVVLDPSLTGADLQRALVTPGDFRNFTTYTNSSADISSYGASVGVNTKVFGGFDLGFNYTYAKFDFDQASDPDFEAGFNTPEHKVKLQFGHTKLFDNFGFNINARWQDEFFWESTFVDGLVDDRFVLDAQINYAIPSIKSVFKLGGANLTGQEFFSAPGVGAIGSQYYLSWTINN
ncbi:TonB-dependent receptor [uncultured Polaribacter sp.]|uniref:TonB-dependent receptor n=1 Tax=uncultured Polaribacter sp. TaxID=174711 RepID=UPI002628A96D|nr:TonB-dependent receptor [uncultured Polaribacter sp.]